MVLDKFRCFPKSEQRKVMLDHKDFISQSIKKAREKLKKEKEKSKKKQLNNQLDYFIQIDEFDEKVSESDLEDLYLL
jgi:Asp-tRNA(Asn)/Glu-tRNA(Gln) amidotransferase C subunit